MTGAFLKSIPGLKNIVVAIRTLPLLLKSQYQWRKLSRKKIIKLELGSGPKKGSNGFTTVDLYGADIYRNLKNGIPLRDNSVDLIYNSHLLEHIDYPNLILFLQECRRVLKIGGKISVCVPNARNYIEAYLADRNFIDAEKMYQPAVIDTGSFLDQVNYVAYMAGEHCYMFDEENLLNTLRSAGFCKVEQRPFDSEIDLRARDHGSIYAVGTK